MLLETTANIESTWPLRLCRSCVRIGGVSLALSQECAGQTRWSDALSGFTVESRHADIEVTVEWVDRLRAWAGRPVFDSGALWKVFRGAGELVFDITSSTVSDVPYKRLFSAPDFSAVRLLLNRQALQPFAPVDPLEYPTDELVITNYLARGLGVEVHGCGLIDSESGGHLFLGHSGAGKSTTTRIWQSQRAVQILSDDRIILRVHNGELWMYGTPWHGEAAFASAGRARLRRIFVLEHGDKNQFITMAKARAAAELFARSFPPFHSGAALTRTVEFLEQVVSLVPCYQFYFVPDRSAVKAVSGFHD